VVARQLIASLEAERWYVLDFPVQKAVQVLDLSPKKSNTGCWAPRVKVMEPECILDGRLDICG
jgi:hypothetical protein